MFNTNPATILAMTRIIVPFVLALAALLCSILVSLNIIGMASAVNNTETISTLKKTNTVNVVIAKGASFPDNKDFFVPSNLTIEGNTTVIWTNNDTVVHTATSGDPKKGPSSQFDSSIIESNKNYNHTFTNVGDFDYYCTLHPFMTGKITVTKQIRPMVTILAPEELPKTLNVTIAQDSSFPDNGKFFVPSEISIAPNGTVSWINEDNIIHAVTSGKPRQAPLGAFDSGVINAGSIFNHTFSKIGIFDYFDQIHPHMVGKVIAGLYTYNLKTNKGAFSTQFSNNW